MVHFRFSIKKTCFATFSSDTSTKTCKMENIQHQYFAIFRHNDESKELEETHFDYKENPLLLMLIAECIFTDLRICRYLRRRRRCRCVAAVNVVTFAICFLFLRCSKILSFTFTSNCKTDKEKKFKNKISPV